jgi:hypothetical protein
MIRYALAVLRTVVLLVLVCGIARAETPTFAIDLRSKDALADKVTSTLEDAMRAIGAAKTADYRAKGTRKDRVAASTDDCPNALTSRCATAIGSKLGVDYMFAGVIETRGTRFVLSLDVFNVKTGARTRSLRDLMASPVDAKKWARRVMERIVDTATGTLELTCSAQRAVVLVDGHQISEVYQGRASIGGLPLGTHALEIRATGYKSYVGDITIDGETKLNVLLDRVP